MSITFAVPYGVQRPEVLKDGRPAIRRGCHLGQVEKDNIAPSLIPFDD